MLTSSGFAFIHLRYILKIPLNWSVILPKSPTSTHYPSDSTSSSVTNHLFSLSPDSKCMQTCEQLTLQWHGSDAWPILNLCHVKMITSMQRCGPNFTWQWRRSGVEEPFKGRFIFTWSHVKIHTTRFHFCDLFRFMGSSCEIWSGKDDCVLKKHVPF